MKNQVCSARPLRLAAAISILVSNVLAAHAQTTSFELQPVTVTGSGAPRTLGSEIAATSVLTRGDIERSGARDAVQVLNLLGTALVEQQGGAGTLAAVRMRGADSRDTLVLIDGVPMNDVASGQALIQQIPAEMIERVEVVRGNLSALYGANATGGVIQIFTRRGAAGGWSPTVSGGIGDRGTHALSAGVSGGSELVSARVNVGTERTDGFSAANGPTANPDKDGDRRSHASVALDLHPAPGHALMFDLSRIDGRADYDSPSAFSQPTDTHVARQVRDAVSARGTHEIAEDWTFSWRWSQAREHRTDTVVGSFSYELDNVLKNDGIVAQVEGYALPGLRVQAGAERLTQSTDSPSYIRNKRDTDVLRIGANYDVQWGSVQANVRHDKTSDFGAATTGLLGTVYKLSTSLSLVGSTSTSFTPPTLDFLFFNCGLAFPCSNPNLKPERAHNIEAGLQWQDAAMLVRGTLFSVRYRDKIGNDALFVPQNIARVKNDGLELTARAKLDAWTLLGEATFQDPKDEDTGLRPIRRAREQYALRADYSHANWVAGAGLRYVGDRRDTTRDLPSYTVVDASASMTLTPQWTVSARIDNLFDRRYEPTVGYNGQPRAVFVGFSWRPKT